MKLEELIDIAINRYIEQDIIRLDVSDATKNRLKRDLRKIFKDEDLINDIKEENIPRAVVEEKINKYDEKIAKMEKDDIGIGFTLGKEWSDLKAKREVLQEILKKESE